MTKFKIKLKSGENVDSNNLYQVIGNKQSDLKRLNMVIEGIVFRKVMEVINNESEEGTPANYSNILTELLSSEFATNENILSYVTISIAEYIDRTVKQAGMMNALRGEEGLKQWFEEGIIESEEELKQIILNEESVEEKASV